jgi:hypothetical protein
MYIMILKDFLLAPKDKFEWVKPLDVAVMSYLIAGADELGWIAVSKLTICAAIGVTSDNALPVNNSLKRLEHKGWIKKHSRRGDMGNQYEIYFDKLPLASIPQREETPKKVEDPQKNLFPGKEDDGKTHT